MENEIKSELKTMPTISDNKVGDVIAFEEYKLDVPIRLLVEKSLPCREDCEMCYFFGVSYSVVCSGGYCYPSARKDKCYVVFKQIKENARK